MLLEFLKLGVADFDAFALENLVDGGIGLPVRQNPGRDGMVLGQGRVEWLLRDTRCDNKEQKRDCF